MSKQNEKLIFHEVIGLPEVKLVEACGIANRFPRHVHSGYTFILIDQGERKVSINSQTNSYHAGEMCIIPPGISHSCESISGNKYGPHSYRAICTEAAYIRKLTEEISGSSHLMPDFDPTTIYRNFDYRSFNELFALTRIPEPSLEQHLLLNTFLYHAINNLSCDKIKTTQKAPRKETLHKIKTFIEKNYQEKTTLQELADLGGLSPFHLQKQFLKQFGLSPQEYIISCRIHDAKEQIQSGTLLTEAALNSGFSDQSHFSRHFKKVIGISPGRFLREN